MSDSQSGAIADPAIDPSPATAARRFWRYGDGQWKIVDGQVAREAVVTIFLNQRELVTVLCTPERLNHLVLGFLYNEGVIDGLSDVTLMRVCDAEATVDVRTKRDVPAAWGHRTLTSGCGGGYSIGEETRDLKPVVASINITTAQIAALMKEMQAAGRIFRLSGGVHIAALSDGRRLIAVAEDIGRHNTVDKICGRCLMEEIDPAGQLLLCTGRLSSEVVLKAARMRVPIIVSRNSPTARAIALAESLGITLVGYARGTALTAYTHPGRLEIPSVLAS